MGHYDGGGGRLGYAGQSGIREYDQLAQREPTPTIPIATIAQPVSATFLRGDYEPPSFRRSNKRKSPNE